MSELLKKNMDAAGGKWSGFAGRFNDSSSGTVEVHESKTGQPVPVLSSSDGRKLFIHSRVDPVREAERFVEGVSLSGRDLVVVLGFGFGYHCELIHKRISREVNLLVIEKNVAILEKAFGSRDLSGLLASENFYLLADPSEDELSALFRGKSSREAIFVTHRGSAQIYPDYYGNIISIIKTCISTKDVNIATLARFEKTWGSNTSRNIGIISAACGVDRFFNRFKGIPAIVAAAGPSLTKSIDFIRSCSGSAVIIAVDTSYKVLVDNGIVPHFTLSVDPQLINARYYEGAGETDTVLVADPTVHPSIFRFFRGRISLTGIAFDMMKWIDDICGAKGELTHGGSVSTNASDFAKRLGASPVYMVGQDLSFTDGLAHARGTYLDEQIHNVTGRFMNAQMFNRRQLSSLPPVYLRGVRGGRVLTNQKLMIFQNWFEKRNDPELINASYDGVYLNGLVNTPHDMVRFDYPRVDVSGIIDEVYDEFSRGKRVDTGEKLKNRIDKMLTEIEELLPALEKALAYSEELSELINSGRDKGDPGKVSYILKKLSEADRFIESMRNSKGLISFSIQRVIHTITEGYDIDSGGEGNPAERSVFLYRGLLEGALFNRKILTRMKSFL